MWSGLVAAISSVVRVIGDDSAFAAKVKNHLLAVVAGALA
jgi:hypothetical protein